MTSLALLGARAILALERSYNIWKPVFSLRTSFKECLFGGGGGWLGLVRRRPFVNASYLASYRVVITRSLSQPFAGVLRLDAPSFPCGNPYHQNIIVTLLRLQPYSANLRMLQTSIT